MNFLSRAENLVDTWVCDRGNAWYRADSLGFWEQKVPIPRSPFNRGYLRRQEELEAQNSHASWPGLLPSFLDSKTPQEVITRPRVPWGSRISRPRHLPDQATPDQSRSRSRCILVPVQCPVGSAEGPETILGNYPESHPCAEFIEFPRKISELSCWDENRSTKSIRRHAIQNSQFVVW